MFTRRPLPLLLLLVAIVAGACTGVTVNAVHQVGPDLLAEPQPDFLRDVQPRPESETRRAAFDTPVDRPGPVCVEVDARPLARPGERLFLEEMGERTTLTIDGRPARPTFRGEFGGLTTFSLEGRETQVGGPYTLCWLAELAAGVHTAEFSYQSPGGEAVSYNWNFTLTP